MSRLYIDVCQTTRQPSVTIAKAVIVLPRNCVKLIVIHLNWMSCECYLYTVKIKCQVCKLWECISVFISYVWRWYNKQENLDSLTNWKHPIPIFLDNKPFCICSWFKFKWISRMRRLLMDSAKEALDASSKADSVLQRYSVKPIITRINWLSYECHLCTLKKVKCQICELRKCISLFISYVWQWHDKQENLGFSTNCNSYFYG